MRFFAANESVPICVNLWLKCPTFSPRRSGQVMSRIRGRGNKDTELALAALLRAHGITGWRRHVLVRVAQW
jgi:hypothetical protein